jgi:hypothetical protein
MTVFVVVDGLPEAHPYVENAQAATYPTKKSAGDCGTKVRIAEQ